MRRPTAGELNRRVRVLRRQDFPDSTDGITPTHDEIAQVWAKIEPVGGAIHYGSVQTGNMVTHRITIRYRTDITAEHEIHHDGTRYRVKRTAALGGGREFTVIDAEELGS
ncbi:phage head closure protein [Azospirillum sp. SYSU D00513]|uniref:phage head closure protein n=1 Tax=Azospirillum sp. SYSU D00513 TaxID=2812561 RepID=UPI001A9704EB|nr:phage head closure protein [Azospirillum sp. SYSU D00513]